MAATRRRRQRVDIVQAGAVLSGRDAMWAAMRKLGEFTIQDIEHQVNSAAHNVRTSEEAIKTYVTGLSKAGYLVDITSEQQRDDTSGRYTRNRWRLAKDCGVDAPRVTRHGKPVTQGQGRFNMWRTLRVLGEFDYRDLAIAATTETCKVDEADARVYVQYLYKAEYLVLRAKANPKLGQLARYRLLPTMNTGPKPPQIQRIKQVFDPNLGQVMWPKAGAA